LTSAPTPERISAGRAGEICGFTAKTMRKLAEDGNIPGAALLGNRWRFDERRLRDWIRRREAECQTRERTTSSSEMGSGMRGSRFAIGTYDEAYAQLLGRKQKSG
jgi:hypothetical protein